MLHRSLILMILAGWSSVWFSAMVHVHTGHECSHGSSGVADHSHVEMTHTHCHTHHGVMHTHSAINHSAINGSAKNNGTLDSPSVSGTCVLCDLISLELAETTIADIERRYARVAPFAVLTINAPEIADRYRRRGRAPPVC